jgi:hypothetical protein
MSSDFFIDLNAVIHNVFHEVLKEYNYDFDKILLESPAGVFDRLTGLHGNSANADRIYTCINYVNFLINSAEEKKIINFKNALYKNIRDIVDDSCKKNQYNKIICNIENDKLFYTIILTIKNFNYNYNKIKNSELEIILDIYNYYFRNYDLSSEGNIKILDENIKSLVNYIAYLIQINKNNNFDIINKILYHNIFEAIEDLERDYGKYNN